MPRSTLDQADVDRLTAFEQFKQVTAPYDGTIIERRIDIGNLVTAGSTTSTTLLYRMAQDDPMRVFVDVPQSAAAELMKVGVPAQISTNDAAGQIITGKITRTAKAIDPQARTFRVEVDIPNPDRRWCPACTSRSRSSCRTAAWSRCRRGAGVRAGGPKVAVVDPRRPVRFRDVTIARDDGDRVELGSGVADGDRLVLNISNQIVEGEKVRVNDDEPPGLRRRDAERIEMRAARSLSAALLLAWLGGCAVGPELSRCRKTDGSARVRCAAAAAAPAAPAAPDTSAAVDLSQWWHALNDPELDSLIERAIRANPDIEIALTRLQEARTQQAVLLGNALPEVAASGGSGTRYRQRYHARRGRTGAARRRQQGRARSDPAGGRIRRHLGAGYVWRLPARDRGGQIRRGERRRDPKRGAASAS